MTLTLLNIDNKHQILVSIILNNITKEFRVITESTNDEQITAFICTPGLTHYSFLEALFKNPPPVLIKSQNGIISLTTIFLDINDETYIIKYASYKLTTRSYEIDTEKIETWEKATFSCPPESTDFAYIENLFKNAQPTKTVSMYQTVWIFDTSLNEPNKSYSKLTWWQQQAFESWHSLQVDTIFLLGEHFITTIFLTADGSPLQVRLRITENLPAIILIPITVQTGEFPNLFVTLKISKTLYKRENQRLDDLLDYMDKNLGRFNEVSHQHLARSCWSIWHLNLTSSASGSILLRINNWKSQKLSGAKFLTHFY